jgi:hypothetical protein
MVANARDLAFIEENKKKLFRLFSDRVLNVALFHSSGLCQILLRVLTDLSGNAMPSRKYNMQLNHVEIRNYLLYITKAKDGKDRLGQQAQELLNELPKK